MTMTEAAILKPEGNRLAPYFHAPAGRDFITELGRIYLEAGLPLAAAFEAAIADYQAFTGDSLET